MHILHCEGTCFLFTAVMSQVWFDLGIYGLMKVLVLYHLMQTLLGMTNRHLDLANVLPPLLGMLFEEVTVVDREDDVVYRKNKKPFVCIGSSILILFMSACATVARAVTLQEDPSPILVSLSFCMSLQLFRQLHATMNQYRQKYRNAMWMRQYGAPLSDHVVHTLMHKLIRSLASYEVHDSSHLPEDLRLALWKLMTQGTRFALNFLCEDLQVLSQYDPNLHLANFNKQPKKLERVYQHADIACETASAILTLKADNVKAGKGAWYVNGVQRQQITALLSQAERVRENLESAIGLDEAQALRLLRQQTAVQEPGKSVTKGKQRDLQVHDWLREALYCST
eukprot:TRINITY_DN50558_c0_g1_i1.p1 TRINITY_DN50558_c0_g1~~TRINITY_DN50558_c0_g1_i1.p1  ORF type:complete len:339 (+),score=53.56 TRINITY_DN50558_c0_g1_i1:78-1094(+)